MRNMPAMLMLLVILRLNGRP